MISGLSCAVQEPAPAPSPAPPPVPTPPVARRLTELSEVSECEEMTPRPALSPQAFEFLLEARRREEWTSSRSRRLDVVPVLLPASSELQRVAAKKLFEFELRTFCLRFSSSLLRRSGGLAATGRRPARACRALGPGERSPALPQEPTRFYYVLLECWLGVTAVC